MYHLFRKTVLGKNGRQVRRWYYWFYDIDGKRKSRACPGCTNRADAEAYVKSLPQQCSAGNLIKDIARDMFLPGSDHVMRREKLGKQTSIDSLRDFRRYILYIIELWGDVEITKLTTKMIVSTLLTIERSSSWKNRLTSILKEVYAEAAWIGTVVTVPPIPRFQKNYRQADVLDSDELSRLFVVDNFPSFDVFALFFLCLLCGLRLGEVRALQYSQISVEKKCILINGFCRRNGERVPFLKKGSEDNPKWRIVVLSFKALQLLERYKCDDQSSYVFMKDGRPYRKEYLESCFKKALAKAGIETEGRRLIPHSLRYTYVTRMRRYAPIELVQKLAGHTSEGMTEYYTRFSIEDASLAVAPAFEAANRLLDE